MRCCWRSCEPRVCWTWTTPRPTARTSERSGGLTLDLRRSTSSARQQAPLDHRPAWHSAGRFADQRKSARCHSTDAPAGGDTPHSGRSRPAAVTDQAGCSPTAATTTTSTVGFSGLAASHRSSSGKAPRTAPDWERPAGSWSGTIPWLHQFKRLRIRYEIPADLHLGLLQLACSIICLRRSERHPETISKSTGAVRCGPPVRQPDR